MLAVAEREQLPVAQAREGDPSAWDVLFRRFQLPLYTYVYELVRDEQQALDIVQETFIRAVRHIGSLRHEGKFGSWLFGIAHQRCLDYWRHTGRAQTVSEELFHETAELPEEPDTWLIRTEDESRFLELLGRLPESQRSALVLHFLEEFSLEQISQILRVPVGTVKSRLHHAKQTLRRLMEEANEDTP
jgi:RNA polymerase sigma-70 factor (ECF subfamily)